MNKKQDTFISNIVRGVVNRTKKLVSSSSNKAGLSWLTIKKLKHLPYHRPATFTFKGSVLHFNNGPELLHSLQEIFAEDIYKIPFTTESPIILDCGANIGLSVLYLKEKWPKARIVAFEPDPANFALLQKNVVSYGLSDVELKNEAVWIENTTLRFVSDGTLGSKVAVSDSKSNLVEVKAIRLSELLDREVDFLKMDIEGAEHAVLMDCGDKLQKVKHLFIEFHGFFQKILELTTVLELVTRLGFSYYIKEAANVYPTPFSRDAANNAYDIQLNIFCFRTT